MLNDQGLFYIDAQSITEENERKTVWSALDYKKPQNTGDGKPTCPSTHKFSSITV